MKNNQTTTEALKEIRKILHDIHVIEGSSVIGYNDADMKLLNLIAQEKKVLLEEVEKEVIGDDIKSDITFGGLVINDFKTEQRKKLQALAKETK